MFGSKVPFTEYIAVTKQICDRLGENTDGVDCSEYYKKPRVYSCWYGELLIHIYSYTSKYILVLILNDSEIGTV